MDQDINTSSNTSSSDLNSSIVQQLRHDLHIARTELQMAGEHGVDLIDHNKHLVNRISQLNFELEQANERMQASKDEKTHFEHALFLAREQRESLSELSHSREKQYTDQITTLKIEKTAIQHSTIKTEALLAEKDEYLRQIENHKIEIIKLNKLQTETAKENLEIRKRESKHLREIANLEKENSALQEQASQLRNRCMDVSVLENELASNIIATEDATRESCELKEQLLVNKEEVEDLLEQLGREKMIRKNIEKSLSQKKFPSELILPGGVITHKEVIGGGDGEEFDPEIGSISQNYYSFSLNNLNHVASSTPIRAGTKPTFGNDTFGTPQRFPLQKSTSLKFKTELQSELHMDQLRTQLKTLEDDKSKMATEFEQHEATLENSIKQLQSKLKNSQEAAQEMRKHVEEFSTIKNVLDLFDLSPDLLECQLEEKLEKLLQNTNTDGPDKHSCVNFKGPDFARSDSLIEGKTETIKKLRQLLKHKETSAKSMLELQKKNSDKMVKMKEDIIKRLVDEVRIARNQKKEYLTFKKRFGVESDQWKGVVARLGTELMMKINELDCCQKRLKSVVLQKGQLDDILLNHLAKKR